MVVVDLSHINLVALLVFLLLSVGLHEAMHGFAAFWLGDTTARDGGRLTLNPLKHLDIYTSIILPIFLVLLGLPPFFIAKPVPFNPTRVKFDEFGAALIGISGPLTNLFLAAMGALFLHGIAGQLGQNFINTVGLFIWLNVALFVFNMIPFPPLDGSRLLYAFAPESLQRVMYRIETGGLTTIFIFMLIFFATGVGAVIFNIDRSIPHLLGISVIGI